MSLPALQLQQFGVGVVGTTIVESIDLTVPANTACFLVGPSGSGKSSLLRALAGLGNRVPGFRTWGSAKINGEELGEGGLALVHQSARLYVSTLRENLVAGLPDRERLTRAEQDERVLWLAADLGLASLPPLDAGIERLALWEQRAVAIARAVLTGSLVVLVDEPTAALPLEEAMKLREVMKRALRHCAILCVTHNRIDAFTVGGQVALLASGQIRESAPVQAFFEEPRHTSFAQAYVETGSCDTTAIAATPWLSGEGGRIDVGPRGFRWVVGRTIGAMPRPGLLSDLEAEVRALAALDISTVLCLEETVPYPTAIFQSLGIEILHFPIVDMRAPTLSECCDVLALLEYRLAAGGRLVFHCKGGLGRTGTMLAALLIRQGSALVSALDEIQNIEPRFVQSDEQREFLESYAAWRQQQRSA